MILIFFLLDFTKFTHQIAMGEVTDKLFSKSKSVTLRVIYQWHYILCYSDTLISINVLDLAA